MSEIDKNMDFLIPYYWGTIGFTFDIDIMKKILPNAQYDSIDLVLNPENLEKIAPYKISFLEEAVDIFPLTFIYLKINQETHDPKDLHKAAKHLQKIRPYIKKFSSSRFINDLVTGEVLLAHTWSGEAQRAIQEAKENGKNLFYMLPKEGSILWIDCIAIPTGAPHPQNAHKFINFILRPDVAAKITLSTMMPTSVLGAKKNLPEHVLNNEGIYPSSQRLKKIFLNPPPLGVDDLNYDRERTRIWAKIRINQYL